MRPSLPLWALRRSGRAWCHASRRRSWSLLGRPQGRWIPSVWPSAFEVSWLLHVSLVRGAFLQFIVQVAILRPICSLSGAGAVVGSCGSPCCGRLRGVQHDATGPDRIGAGRLQGDPQALFLTCFSCQGCSWDHWVRPRCCILLSFDGTLWSLQIHGRVRCVAAASTGVRAGYCLFFMIRFVPKVVLTTTARHIAKFSEMLPI